MDSRLTRVSITILRFLLAAWIGAAVLYVITSVAEQTSEHFDSRIRDQLAALRFPLYYQFGFVMHAAALVCGLLVTARALAHRARFAIVSALIVLSLAGITLDYLFVFQPLLELITPAGQVRTQEFVRLHNLSRYANQAHIMVMMIAGVVAAWPLPARRESDERLP
ncbi:MAG: hypothetical protein NXI04_08390 [Planctomycetaceae bacterium]|nr:hypothetical protein [Planctomycetaceae bacterium]